MFKYINKEFYIYIYICMFILYIYIYMCVYVCMASKVNIGGLNFDMTHYGTLCQSTICSYALMRLLDRTRWTGLGSLQRFCQAGCRKNKSKKIKKGFEW